MSYESPYKPGDLCETGFELVVLDRGVKITTEEGVIELAFSDVGEAVEFIVRDRDAYSMRLETKTAAIPTLHDRRMVGPDRCSPDALVLEKTWGSRRAELTSQDE